MIGCPIPIMEKAHGDRQWPHCRRLSGLSTSGGHPIVVLATSLYHPVSREDSCSRRFGKDERSATDA